MGFGIAQCSFDQSNAMLALSAIFKFSAKNITDTLPWFFIIEKQIVRAIFCRDPSLRHSTSSSRSDRTVVFSPSPAGSEAERA